MATCDVRLGFLCYEHIHGGEAHCLVTCFLFTSMLEMHCVSAGSGHQARCPEAQVRRACAACGPQALTWRCCLVLSVLSCLCVLLCLRRSFVTFF